MLIQGGIIAGPCHDLRLPGATEVDGRGRTLLPGLIDAHVHTPASAAEAEEGLRQALALGLTTVFCMGAEPAVVARAGRLARARTDLADLRSAGYLAIAPDGHPTQFGAGLTWPKVAGPEAADRFVADRLADGSDYVKVILEDGERLWLLAPEPGARHAGWRRCLRDFKPDCSLLEPHTQGGGDERRCPAVRRGRVPAGQYGHRAAGHVVRREPPPGATCTSPGPTCARWACWSATTPPRPSTSPGPPPARPGRPPDPARLRCSGVVPVRERGQRMGGGCASGGGFHRPLQVRWEPSAGSTPLSRSRDQMEGTVTRLTIVGAGVSGLVAAIEAAERGWSVTVLEAAGSPGGRGRTLAGPYRANTGPHGLYVDGSLWSWLEHRELIPPVVTPARGMVPRGATLVLTSGRLGYWPAALDAAIAALPEEAPVETPFRSWLLRRMEQATAEAIVGLLFVVTYDHDPGRLSAAFTHERLRRSMSGAVRFVVGGFGTLVDRLAERATQLGVELRTRTPVREVGGEPTLIATSLDSARKITGDATLDWLSGATALLDLGLEAEKGIDWFRILDLDERTYTARFSELDPVLAPPGHDLVQAAAPCRPGEEPGSALHRIEDVLDMAWPGWRGRVRWQRRAVMRGLTGALDLPGTTWRDRPAVHRGGDLYVATDQSAAPGVLAEVGAAAALQAVADMSATPLRTAPHPTRGAARTGRCSTTS